MINIKLSELLNTPPVLDEDDSAKLNICYFGRFDLFDGFKASDKPVVRPDIRVFYIGDKNEER